ncbi:MAG: fibronectin type III domain-containing protein, partial [Fibrobacter sp.]|nr:fibronectin type III domain-containing protein [Fibrobacter sp.]
MSDSLPKWKSVGTTNTAVVMYNLEGDSKSGKYYRVSAKDDCGVSKATDMVEIAATGANATTNADLATPSNLKLENLGDNMWQLSWSYTNNENRPEQGFKLQSLNLDDKSPKWSDDGTTNKGVHVVKIDGNKKGGLLYHVAAKDDKGVSEYSEEITIPRVSDSTSTSNSMDLAVPTNLKLDSIDVSKYKLSWSYTDNTNRPENGF